MLADIVNEKRTDGTPIVGGRDSAITLLTSSIPDIELDGAQVLPIVSIRGFARRKARNILW